MDLPAFRDATRIERIGARVDPTAELVHLNLCPPDRTDPGQNFELPLNMAVAFVHRLLANPDFAARVATNQLTTRKETS